MGKADEGSTSVKDYDLFDNGSKTATVFQQDNNTASEEAKSVDGALSDDVYKGPTMDSIREGLKALQGKLALGAANAEGVSKYLLSSKGALQGTDAKNQRMYLVLKDGKVTESDKPGSFSGELQRSTPIPSDLSQRGYTVTCYESDGWHLGGSSYGTAVASGTKQESVHQAWVKDGARYKNGIAVMNVDGQDCYLVATASALGDVGDAINVQFANGQEIPCVVADAKSSNDWNYTKYGHSDGNGNVNILEFEVNTADYNSKGNPNTEGWNLEWDSTSKVSNVDNYGTVLK